MWAIEALIYIGIGIGGAMLLIEVLIRISEDER